jgi:hypothetical protein
VLVLELQTKDITAEPLVLVIWVAQEVEVQER